jgi:hypothetical protein
VLGVRLRYVARNMRLSVLTVAVVVLAATACDGASESAQAPPDRAPPSGPTLEVAGPLDAREIFERYGVGDPDGKPVQRPDLDDVILGFWQRVRRTERHRFGGLYIRQEPAYGVVVLLTSGDVSDLDVPEPLRRLVVVRNVERTLAELRAMHRRVMGLRSVVQFGSNTNEHLNRVEIELIGPTRSDLESATQAIGDAAAQSGEPLPDWVTVVGSVVPLDETPGETPVWLLRHAPVGSGSAFTALLGGVLELHFDRDCVLLSGQAVVWPAGTTLTRDPPQLNLPGGLTARPGDTVSGGGGHVPALGVRQASSGTQGDLDKARACATEPQIMVFGPRGEDIDVTPGG